MKYKLVKPNRGRYWLIRLPYPCAEGWRERSTKQTRRREAERVAAQIVAGLLPADAAKLNSDQLQAMMRHADIKTTRTHYAHIQAEQLAEQVSAALNVGGSLGGSAFLSGFGNPSRHLAALAAVNAISVHCCANSVRSTARSVHQRFWPENVVFNDSRTDQDNSNQRPGAASSMVSAAG